MHIRSFLPFSTYSLFLSIKLTQFVVLPLTYEINNLKALFQLAMVSNELSSIFDQNIYYIKAHLSHISFIVVWSTTIILFNCRGVLLLHACVHRVCLYILDILTHVHYLCNAGRRNCCWFSICVQLENQYHTETDISQETLTHVRKLSAVLKHSLKQMFTQAC